MKTAAIALTYVFVWLTIFGFSSQDGFNFYKALNRTPMNRVERFYKDGISSRYDVRLSKRLLYDGFTEQKNTNARQNHDFIAILFNWSPDMKFNAPNKQKNEDECVETQNFIPDVVSV